MGLRWPPRSGRAVPLVVEHLNAQLAEAAEATEVDIDKAIYLWVSLRGQVRARRPSESVSVQAVRGLASKWTTTKSTGGYRAPAG
jgi:hypothetical protein